MATGFTIKIPMRSEFDNKYSMALDNAGYLIAAKLQEYIIKETPYKTGHLGRTVVADYDRSRKVVWVGSPLKYAEYVERGTRPHEIRPRNKKALAWGKDKGGGKKEFVRKRVMHPGTDPNPFVERAIRNAFPEIENIIRESFKNLKIE